MKPVVRPISNQEADDIKAASAIDPNAYIKPATPEQVAAKRVLTEDDILTDAIEARPFDPQSYMQVKPKDPDIVFRWVNWKHDGGAWYHSRKAIGFVDAVADDVDGPIPSELTDVGQIKHHDVILMKINKLRLYQAYKANMLKAQAMMAQKNRQPNAAANSAIGAFYHDQSGTPKEVIDKVGFFVPGDPSQNKVEVGPLK